MTHGRRALRLLSISREPLFWFETVYKLAGAALIVPGFSACFNLLTHLTGHRYLTAENLRSFLLHPLTLLFALFLLAVMALYFLVDMGVVACMLDQAAQGQRCTVLFALRHSLRSAKKALRPASLLMQLYLPLLGLFLHTGIAAALIATVRIPVPITTYILKNALYMGLLALAALLLCAWMLMWLFVPFFHLVAGETFQESIKKSARLARRRWRQALGTVLLVQCGLMVLYGLAAFIGLLALKAISASLARSFLTSHVLTFLVSALLAVSVLSIPLNYAALYPLLEDDPAWKHLPPYEEALTPRQRRLRRALGILALLLTLAGCVLIVYRYQRGHYNLDIEYLHTMEITAHRGDSAHAPENTMAAFERAWENGADWIELDVHQSSDGAVFCMHDNSFARVAGVKKRAWELDWDTIRQLDAGSHFSRDYAGEGMPLLEEAIDFAALHGVRLNIELKPTAYDINLEEAVVNIIRDRNFEDQCVVTCQRYDALKKVKEYAPELTTVYVMSMVYGNLEQLTDADHFSVNYSFINRDMVSHLHRMGKQIYAWTVDRADIMQRMIDLGVDNIITNNVALGKDCVSAAAASEIVQTIVEEWVETE